MLIKLGTKSVKPGTRQEVCLGVVGKTLFGFGLLVRERWRKASTHLKMDFPKGGGGGVEFLQSPLSLGGVSVGRADCARASGVCQEYLGTPRYGRDETK